MSKICEECGDSFKSIGQHWAKSSCNYKSFTDKQIKIITGLLMGDGCINKFSKGNPRLKCCTISKNYLKYLDSEFANLVNGVRLDRTAKDKAEENRRSGFGESAKEENYSELYEWNTVCHPELERFVEWYSSGKKQWPEEIKLTPITLKHWYCGDGSYHNSSTNNYITIAISNEYKNTDKISKMFERVNLPVPDRYSSYENTYGTIDCELAFSTKNSKIIWEYMGKPLPDFEYKWPKKI